LILSHDSLGSSTSIDIVGFFATDLLLLYFDVNLSPNYFKPVELVKENICDWSKIREHVLWADCVVWLAALVGDPACAIDPNLTNDINVNSLAPLLKEFKGRLIFPSTCSVYGAQDG
jgi:nucleoside-diphosphate-sugar epimerase